MKKTFMKSIVSLFLAFAVVISVAFSADVARAGQDDIIDHVPANGLFYFRFTDLKGVHKKLEPTNFYKNFIALKIFDEMNALIEKMNQGLTFKISIENFLKVYGTDMIVSAYIDKPEEGKRLQEPKILLSTALDGSSAVTNFPKVIENFIYTMDSFGKGNSKGKGNFAPKQDKTKIDTETYNDINIYHVYSNESQKKKGGAYYLVIDNVFHMSSSVDLAKEIIDIAQETKGTPLSKSETYKKVSGKFRKGNFASLFLDTLWMTADIEKSFKVQFGANAFSDLSAYDIIYFDAIINDGIDSAGATILKDDKSNKAVKLIQSVYQTPGQSDFNKNVKKQPLLFGSAVGISFKQLYGKMKEESSLNQLGFNLIDSIEKEFTKFSDMSLEKDVISFLTGDLAIYFASDLDTSSPFIPMPKVFIGIKVNDKEKFSKVYDKLTKSIGDQLTKSMGGAMGTPPGAPVGAMEMITEEEYKGYKFKYMMSPLGISPGHALIDDYYYIYTGPSMIKEVIDDLKSSSNPFGEAESLKKGKSIIHSDYNSYSFLDFNALLDLVPELYGKYAMMLQGSMSKSKREEFTKVYNEMVLPFIKTFKAVKYSVSSKYYDKEKNTIFFKGYTATEDIK